jgi:hypothetical protein
VAVLHVCPQEMSLTTAEKPGSSPGFSAQKKDKLRRYQLVT